MIVLSWLDAIIDKQHHFRSGLEDLLSIVNCAIVSTTRNSQVDAYVLSESSMFISRRRFILKTCGTTTPLDCIEHLTRLVTEHAKFDTVEVKQFIFVHLYFLGTWFFLEINILTSTFVLFQEIFYSRKNFQRPDLQKPPHKNFREEVKILEKYFGAGAGSDDEIFMCNIFYPYISLLSLLHGQPE